MKYMLTWTISPSNYKAAVKRFLETGALAPPGVRCAPRAARAVR